MIFNPNRKEKEMRFIASGVGRLVKDPILEKTASNNDVCKFTVACDNGKEGSCFYWCIAYGKTAEFIVKFFGKGKPIHVSGEIGQYKSDKDGMKHTYIDVRSAAFVPSEVSKAKEAKDSLDSEDDVPF